MSTKGPKRNQVSITTPFGVTGSYTNYTFLEKFRTFSKNRNSLSCMRMGQKLFRSRKNNGIKKLFK